MVQSPLAKAASETTAETNSDSQPADEEATTPTQPADSPKQHTIINQDGIYASNGKGTYNTLSKDGLWVGGRDDGEGLYVDNDGNMRTTGNVMVDGAFSAGGGNAYIAEDGSTSIQVGGSQFIVNSDIAGMSNGNASVSVMNNSAEVRAADNLIAAGIDGITMSERTGNTTVTVNQDGMTVDGDLTVTGDTNLKDTGVDGTLNVSGNQTVGGNSTVKGNQTVGGTITANKGIIGGVILETTAEDGKSKITAQKADIDGVWIKEGSITTEEGTITAGDVVINSAGSEKINVGNGNFIVYEDGAVRAADDNFIVHKDGSVEAQGTVQAADATNFEVGSRELVTAGQLAAAGIVPGTAFENGVAIGENAMATAAYTVAVGEGSQAFGNSSTALGYDTHVDASAKNAVALGANSVADRADTVSVGSKDNERQITNVAAGTASTDAVNVKQLTDRTANMVEWDEGTDDTIHGVTLENGMITAADGKFKVYGTGGIYAADGKFQVNGNTGDVSADGNLKAADGKFFVNGESGSVTAADGDFKVSSKGDVTAAGSLTAADEKFKVYGASGGFMAADGKVEVNGYTGDIRTDGKVTANEIHAANDNFIVYESGVVKLNGGNLVIGTNGDLNSKGTITGNVLSTGGFVANADGNAEAKGTVTANTLSTGADGFIANSDGDFEARNAHIDGTLLVGEKFKVTPDGELIAANSAFKVGADGTVTAVRGGSIGGVELKDGEVTGLNNTMWDAGDIVNDRAATEGQMAVVDAQVNANSDELTKYKNAGIVAGGASEIGNGIALGAGSSANAGSIAVGDMAWVMGKDSVGLGNDISVGGSDAVAIGNNINLVANNSVALGNGSAAARENTVSVGSSGNERQITNVAAGTEGTDAVNVNQLNEVKSSVTSVGDDLAAYKAAGIVPGVAVPEDVEGAMALGEGSEAVNVNAVAVGPSAKASGSFSLAFGAGATTDGANAMALGRGSNSSADNAIALGKGTEALAKNAIAIGAEASAVANNSVALGVNSKATESNVISVGDVGSERKIVNVADGKNEHDAVNFGQLKEVRDVTDKLTGAGVVGGYVGETTTSMAAGVQSSATGETVWLLGRMQ